MHPAKKTSYRETLDFIGLQEEMGKRLQQNAKRNVAFTSTVEIPVKNIPKGVPNRVNIAIISDSISKLFGINGKETNQDIHDGASYMSYIYSKMMEASYPSKKYLGTKKQFGVFINEFGSAVKKDAEVVITNKVMIESLNSPISYLRLNIQMLSSHDLTNIKIEIPKKNSNVVFFDNGDYYKISNYSISNNNGINMLNRTLYKYVDGK